MNAEAERTHRTSRSRRNGGRHSVVPALTALLVPVTFFMAPIPAIAESSSRSGTGVFPESRVMMTVWETSGRVNSCLRVAAAAQALVTPGTTSYSIPSLSSSAICSWIAP